MMNHTTPTTAAAASAGLPPSLAGLPPAKGAAFAMLFSMGDALDWTQDHAGLEIAALINPGAHDRSSSSPFVGVATLGALAGMDDWHAALRKAGAMNARPSPEGANIFVRPSPRMAHPWILLDDLPPARAGAITQQHAAIAVETSPGNAQAWLLLDAHLGHPERTRIVQMLAKRLETDPNAANGSQPGRLAGFQQRKAGKSGWTNVISDTSRTLMPWPTARLMQLADAVSVAETAGARAGVISGDAPPAYPTGTLALSLSADRAGPQAPSRAGQGALSPSRPAASDDGGDQSAREFAFACHRLRDGWPADRVKAAVASHALSRGKRRAPAAAERYAHSLVAAAARAVGVRP